MKSQAYDLNNVKYIHPKLIALSLVVSLFAMLMGGNKMLSIEALFAFFMVYVQVVIFIELGRRMFKIEPGTTPKEITKNIVFRYLQYHFLCLIISAFVFVVALALIYMYKDLPLSNLIPNIIEREIRNWLIATNLGLAFGAFMFFLFQWQDALKREHNLKEEKLAFQFETLNNQVNPHFLFNSLNTLSSFIKSQPEIAEKYVANLASIYRYIIDNAPHNKIELQKELGFVKDYFYLHQLRDEGKIELKVNIPNAEDYLIIPVSLQILIENALKHNLASKSKPLLIKVFLDSESIVVKNNLQKKTLLEASPKKGLKNLDARMKLITGKGIDIIESRDEYLVRVPLIIVN